MNVKLLMRHILPLYLLVFLGGIIIAQIGNDTVTVMVERLPISNRTCVIIDAGHGGIDCGAISCTGTPESEINLQIAKRLNDLMNFLGFKTAMLRQTDTSLHTEGKTIAQQKISDLRYRVDVANNTENAMLISIHQNTFSDKKYHGAQVFYSHHEESRKLAEQLQFSFISTLNPTSKRKSKAAKGIYLLEHIQCSGVLIECGFLTNPEEEAKLRSCEYQKNLCCVIACCISEFRDA
jgi:N-acetylmuramoyl-L-alanine amidase